MFDRTFALVCAAFAGVALPQLANAQCGTWETHFNTYGLSDTGYTSLVFDDGGGPALYVGGEFVRAGSVTANGIAKWDGSAWHALGAGFPGRVSDLRVFEGALHAAPDTTVQRWNGSAWEQLGGAFDGLVFALEVYDDGSGPALYAGGSFFNNGGQFVHGIARWNGSEWLPVGAGVGTPTTHGYVYELKTLDDGSGQALYVGGEFSGAAALTSPDLVRWNGSSWSAVGAGIEASASTYVRALHSFDFGNGPVIVVGGTFPSASGVPVNSVAAWNGTSYAALGGGLSTVVNDFTIFPGSGGDELIAGGTFSTRRWNGSGWEMLGGPGNDVLDLTVFDDGSGPALIGVGWFVGTQGSRISRWDGATWSPLPDGNGLAGRARAFASFDDGNGPSLFVGGTMTMAGTIAAKGLARWSGSAWSALPIELNSTVESLLVWDDGSGPALIAGGFFTQAGPDSIRHIGRWDGAGWTGFGIGIGGSTLGTDAVLALEAFDDGSGAQLYAGGNFSSAGGGVAVGIARWDGSNWNALEVGTNSPVLALKSFDDGSGPGLFVAGDFTQAGSVSANHIARWDGSAWHALGTGAPTGNVSALVVFDEGSGPNLYAGGTFTSMSGVAASGLARWDGALWHAVPKPFATAQRLAVVDLGSGPDLVASTNTQVYRRSAGAWTLIGTLPGPTVSALSVFDSEADGTPDLYVGGQFSSVSGISSVNIASLRGCGATAQSFCTGDGLGTACPCGNDGEPGHGCENSTLSGGALLTASGVPSVAHDSVRLNCVGVPTNTTTLFVQATGQANGGLGTAFGDGLLCISGAVLRIGSPSSEGETASVGFGTGSTPISIKGQLPPAGATRHYQCRYRNSASYCTSATFNESNGVSVIWTP